MIPLRATLRILVAAAAASLAACGGGSNPADARPGEAPPQVTEGPRSFLRFPNPQARDGSLETDTLEYAQAYYRAIDPTNARDTLAKWKAANGFGTGTGTEVSVVFGDARDLGYGRRMTARQNADGTFAFFVDNYLVEVGDAYDYSPINLDAAILRDSRWHVGTTALEFSPGPAGGASFAKFFSFAPDGTRELAADIDGRGPKAMPAPCLTCHGGRGDALTAPDASGVRHFPRLPDAVSGHRGDALGRVHAFLPDTFDYSTRPGFTRVEQEAALKAINRMVLCTYPLAAASALPEDACRRAAGSNEWQGTAAQIVKDAYGGDGLPAPAFTEPAVPASWVEAGQAALYAQVVAPLCRTCHIALGTRNQSDLDFATYEKFAGYSDRIKALVIDRGNMPLARIVFDGLWENPERVELLARFLEAQGFTVRDAAGAVLRPGRPVADPGPDRVASPGATRLSAEASLFSDAFAWSLLSGPAGATLSGADTPQATLNASEPGTYAVQLVSRRGDRQSDAAVVRVVVDPRLQPEPAAVRFADVKAVLTTACAGCHRPGGFETPIYFANVDRDGDGGIDETDDAWFHAEVRSRVNFTDVAASPLLRKPSGHHHRGRQGAGFDATAAPGDAARERYDLFLNWILNGAPR